MVKDAKRHGYHLSFTGHSLGAFLAELSVFYCHKDFKYPQASAVTFESPGGEEILKRLQPHSDGKEISLKDLDIVGYLSDPNMVNTFGPHVGTFYHISPTLTEYNPYNPVSYTLQSHSITNIVKYLSGDYFKGDDAFAYYMTDWPKSNWDGLIKKMQSSGGSAIKNIVKDVAKNPFSLTAVAGTVLLELGKVLGRLSFYTYFNVQEFQSSFDR